MTQRAPVDPPWAGWTAPALAIALVLAVDPWAVQVFVVPKWLVLCVGVPAALGALASIGGLRWPARPAWVGLLVVVAAATATGTAPLLSLVGAPYRYLGATTWTLWAGAFVVGASSPVRTREHLADVLCVAVAMQGLVAVVQRAGLDPFGVESDLDRARAWGTFGSASLLGSFAALVLPVALGRLRGTGHRPAVAGVVGAAVCLVAAGSRGALIGALVGIGVLAALSADRRTAAFVVAVLVSAGVLVTPGTSERVLAGSGVAAASASGRLAQWDLTTDLLADRPLLGSGPETYRIRFPAVADDDFETAYGRDLVQDRAHNILLDTWVTLGVAGVAALAWLTCSVVRLLAVARREPIVTALGAGLAAYAVTLAFSFQDAHLDAVVWLAAGVALAPGGPARPVRRPFVLVAAAMAVVLGGWALRDVLADHRAEAALSGGPADAGALVDVADLAPDRVLYGQVAARATSASGDHRESLRLLDRALDVASRDPDLLHDRADALARAALAGHADLGAAAAAYEQLVGGADPASGRAWLGYGIVLAELGRLDDAEAAWARAARLRPDDPDARANLARLADLRRRPGG